MMRGFVLLERDESKMVCKVAPISSGNIPKVARDTVYKTGALGSQ